MILWIWRLIVGCNHNYQFITKFNVYNTRNELVYVESIHRCQKCMKVRKDQL